MIWRHSVEKNSRNVLVLANVNLCLFLLLWARNNFKYSHHSPTVIWPWNITLHFDGDRRPTFGWRHKHLIAVIGWLNDWKNVNQKYFNIVELNSPSYLHFYGRHRMNIDGWRNKNDKTFDHKLVSQAIILHLTNRNGWRSNQDVRCNTFDLHERNT